uniref:inner nuclear membrane protein Man1-like isoform X2 n=1 Tax=Myxine glutinosa TaxID=7769 RepID=UPI00358FF445
MISMFLLEVPFQLLGPEGLVGQHVKAYHTLWSMNIVLIHIQGDYDCGDRAHTRRISLEDARDFILAKNLKYKSFNDSLLRIINSTSDLGMRLIGEKNDVGVRNVTEVRFLESTHPRMSLSCRIWRACISVLRKVLLFLVGVFVVWFVMAFIHYLWRKEEVEVWQVYHMAGRITDTLQSHSQRCREDEALPPFLLMENVKNMIIPQHDRVRLRRVWERAEAFICKHEPRAKRELRRVGGQDCPVWCWIPSTRSTLQRSQGKIWQGKAFQWDRRTYPSPTPCLKIRNMFDPDMEVGETWHLSIHDAILDRCRDNDGIAHIEVDKSSHEGCVYIKCLAPEHAGKAFKALHGSWFDGKLVTVKYLRLDRYHQRFPHAIHSNSPLHRTSHVVLPSS